MADMLQRKLPDMILLDIAMPEIDGYKAINMLKANPKTKDIPVIFLTARSDSDSELRGLELGAIDYVSKPFSAPLLRKRVELHLLVEAQRRELQTYNQNLQEIVRAKTMTVLKLQNKILQTVANMVECRDPATGGHIERTQRCLGILISALLEQGLYPGETEGWDVELLQQSSQLHDVGKIYIRDSILQKPGGLTAEEFQEMQRHVDFGVKIIERIEEDELVESDFLSHAKVFANFHHEKWNGSGYPHKLRGNDIPLLGRLMAIADVYDALVSARPYKEPLSHGDAVDIIKGQQGIHFDPELTVLFLDIENQLDV
jgi:putative two-component system response regulator